MFFKILQNSKESTCVGFSCVGDTNSRIESVILTNFLHSIFARFTKKLLLQNILWEKCNMKRHISHILSFCLKVFIFFLKFGNEV